MASPTASEFISNIEYLLSEMWLNTPWQFQKLNAGLVDSGAGTRGQYLANYQGLQDYLIGIGPDVLYRFVQLSEDTSYLLSDLKTAALAILFMDGTDLKVSVFARIEFCGLSGFRKIGDDYYAVLTHPNLTIEQFRDATKVLWQLFVRAHRWNHMFFPWNIGAAYPQRLSQAMNDMVSTIMPAHPTKSRAESPKIDFEIYNYSPWQAPVTGVPKPKQQLTNPKWQSFINIIQSHTTTIWRNKPWEIQKVEFGLINGEAGSGFQYYSDLVHMLIYLRLSGATVIYRLTQVVQNDSLDVNVAKKMLRVILLDTFNAFEFLADLSLAEFHWLGTREDEEPPYTGLYWQALADSATTKNEFVQMNMAYLNYINRMLAWVDYIYPWNMGGRLSRQTDLDATITYNVMLQHPIPTVGA
ncbi:hypothetical protein [Verminephrobacter aporrectodeae]|uniref:cucumopine synthase-related protein n=1 Tax=Verminephrobacter aporrectodeae TaxID=1110389 RepID=UPI001110DB2C|nr:hypothetical protein [Verminephrobacter aporrectodeae]